QRRPRVASLLALGGNPASLSRDLLAEASLLGIFGAMGGIPIGIAAGAIAVRMLPPFLVQTVDAHVDYVVPSGPILFVLLATTGTTLMASIVAVRSISHTSPIEAMTLREASHVEHNRLPLRRTTAVGGVACLIAAAALAAVVHDERAIAAAVLCSAGGLALAY